MKAGKTLSDKKPDYTPKVIHINRAQEINDHALKRLEDSVVDAIDQAYKDGVTHSLVIYMLHMYLQIETARVFDEEE
jgi:hypothetical protein